MALKYDMNAIFEDLEKIAMEKIQKKANEKKKEEPPDKKIESPEDAESTEVVIPATLKISELVHGGDESSKEIENSKNVADGGENERDSKLKNNDESLKEEKDNAKEQEKNEENDKSESDENEIQGEKENTIVEEEEKGNYNGTSEENENDIFKKQIEQMFVRKSNEIEELKENNKPEYIKKQVIEIIKKIADMHSGIDVQDGSERYDKRKMIMHMLKGQDYKLMNDKSDLMDARYVQFFIDTSGIYGSSNRLLNNLLPEIIGILERQGYECYLASCGNGFYEEDTEDIECYHTRRTLEQYRAGTVNKIACPTPKTAAKMANNAEFSVIVADFDGLSSIYEMAEMCDKDKVPYFLCTEDRYPWEDPTLHSWVRPDKCTYDFELVYDISMGGNPTLEEYTRKEEEYEESYYDNNDYEER